MKYLGIIFLWITLASCQSNIESGADVIEDSTAVDSDYWTEHHCMRGKPISTIDTTKVTDYSFELLKDKAIEKGTLPNGDKIVISNEGCEVFWLSFSVYINNYNQNTPNIDLVIRALEEVKEIENAPIDFEKALVMIKKIKEGGGNIKLGNEYFLKMDSISEMFEIDEIDLKKGYATIEFSFAIGKL